MTLNIITMIILAYLSGSLSGAMFISRWMKLANPNKNGSNNPGATNVYRLSGKVPAILVLLFDMAKGCIPVLFSYHIGITSFFLGIVGIAACLGHMYPCFFHFQGGKGVATALGIMAPIGFDVTGCFIATWLSVLLFTGYSSLAAIIGFLLAPIYVWIFKPVLTLPVVMLSCLIILRHSHNISRLHKHQEPKSVHIRWNKK